MRLRHFSWAALALVSLGCAARSSLLPADVPTHALTIRWQRLVDSSNQTCPRCASTEQEVQKAYTHLKQSLGPAGIAVEVEADRIAEAAFLAAPLESNRIWINGRPLEDLLRAQSGSSLCGGCCGDSTECRSVMVDGKTYEAIPAGIIIRAGFLAAADELRKPAPGEGRQQQVP